MRRSASSTTDPRDAIPTQGNPSWVHRAASPSVSRLADFGVPRWPRRKPPPSDAHIRWTVPTVVGKFFALGAEAPYKHSRIFGREPTTGPDRLRIGGGPDSVAVLNELIDVLREPLYVLVVLTVPRRSTEGRYESQEMTRGEVSAFLGEFHDLFVLDSRSSVWVGSIDGSGLVVLDEHDLLYAYGPLDEFAFALRASGYTDGTPTEPFPHVHHFNEALDALEILVVGSTPWRRVLPLSEKDVP
jgi:hypothetical protein